MPKGEKPTKEIADMGKVILVPNLSYLFSAGTGAIMINVLEGDVAF